MPGTGDTLQAVCGLSPVQPESGFSGASTCLLNRLGHGPFSPYPTTTQNSSKVPSGVHGTSLALLSFSG